MAPKDFDLKSKVDEIRSRYIAFIESVREKKLSLSRFVREHFNTKRKGRLPNTLIDEYFISTGEDRRNYEFISSSEFFLMEIEKLGLEKVTWEEVGIDGY